VEDRISGLKHKVDIKEKKPKEFLDKIPKGCKRNTKTLQLHQIPNLRIMGIKKEEVQANIFNKLKQKISLILRKRCPFRCRKPPGHQIDMTKIKYLHSILQLK
jgi:hypothetical protein